MNNNNLKYKDPIRNLFENLPEETVSENFSDNLMLEIEQVVVREKRKSRLFSILFPTLGGLLILLVPVFVVVYFDIDIRGLLLSWFPKIEFSPFVIMIGLLVLFLLILDTLLRKYIENKKGQQTTDYSQKKEYF